MVRGIQVVAMMVSIVLAVSFLGSLGAYSAVNAGSFDTEGQDSVNRIVATLEDQNSALTGVAELDPIASFIIGGLDVMEVMWIIVSDTSALVQLLGAPPELADVIETLARLAFGLMIMYAVVRMRLD